MFTATSSRPAAPSHITDQLDTEQLVIPVVSQEQYFIHVMGVAGATNGYELEIENFPAPIPNGGFLDPLSDTGRSDADNVTNDNTPHIFIQADILQFVDTNHNNQRDVDEILPLTAAQAVGGTTAGAAVEVWITNKQTGARVRGYANPLDVTVPVLWDVTPGAAFADGVYIVTAATRIFDGQQDAGGDPDPADARTLLSDPLFIFTVDTLAPNATFGHILVANDGLAAASDSGVRGPANAATFADRITNDTTPTFFGVADANVIVQAWLDVDGNGSIGVSDRLADRRGRGDPAGWKRLQRRVLEDHFDSGHERSACGGGH